MRTLRALISLLVFGCAISPPSEQAPLVVGTAKVKITPAEPMMLSGYGSRNKLSEGVEADLFARALAIDDGKSRTVIVSADIIAFGPVIGRAIKSEALRRFGLPEERLLLVGSHTHNGPVISEPALVDHPEQIKERDPYVESLREKVLQAIGEALKSTSPATLEMARGEATFGKYRRVKKDDGTWGFGIEPKGVTDPDVPVLVAKGVDGKIRAVLFTYACHCTSVRNNNEGFYRFHPDWAVCCSRLEEKMPGAQVMFVTGCGGDIDPGPRGPIAEAEKNGQAMIAAIEKVLKEGRFRPVSGPIRAKLKRIDLPLEKPDRAAFNKMAATGRPGDQRFAKEQLAKMDAGTLTTSIDYPIQVLHFGTSFTMVSLAGETCVEYALRLKKELGADRTWVTGYSNEVPCYIPSERILNENGYESGWTLSLGRGIATSQMSGSGWPTPFALGIEDRIVTAAKELVAAPGGGGSYRAGTAKVKITPEKFGWLTGYGARTKPADGVALDLYARALALEDSSGKKAVMVTAEILGFPPSMSRWIRDEARKRHGLSDEQLLLTASHTHAGPAMPERPSMEVFHGFGEAEAKTVHEYAEWLRETVVVLVGKALSDLQPAKLSFSRTKATYAMNRRLPRENNIPALADNPKGITDPDVPVLEIESKDGKTRAIVFTYACHCTTLGGGMYQYHGDHAGAACQELEKSIPGAVALFVTGCGGDINPSPRGDAAMAEKHGRALAAAVRGALGTAAGRTISGDLRMSYRSIELPLEAAPARELVAPLVEHKDKFRQRHAKETLRLLDAGKLPSAVPFPILTWQFGGDLTLIALSGETCVEYALRLKKELGEDRTWVAGYSNEVPCYIPSEKVLAEGGYEAGWDNGFKRTLASGSMMYYGWPVPFAPGIEERILNAVHASVGR
jgi:neutral ceramidase